MSFTDQKPRVATEEDLNACWSGRQKGESFRCYLCGYKFKVGDIWRWVFMGDLALTNLIVCEKCDTPDVKEKWKHMHDEFDRIKEKFWRFVI